MGREGPGLPVSWAGGWRKPICGRRRWSGGSGSFPPGTLAAPSSVLRVHLTPADLPPRPIAKVGDSWAQGEEMGQRTQSSDRGARLGDNCSYYSELRLNQAQPPARLGDALLTGWRWMEVPLSPILPPPRILSDPGAITVPPGWTRCPPPWLPELLWPLLSRRHNNPT